MDQLSDTRLLKIIDARSSILEEPVADNSGWITYYPSSLCRIGLPTKSQPGVQYQRFVGNMRLTVSVPHPVELPYGIYPRGFFTLIAREVTRQKEQGLSDPRLIELGRSHSKCLAELSGSAYATGGKNGNLARMDRQLESLVRSHIDVDMYDTATGKMQRYTHYDITSAGLLTTPILWSEDEQDSPAPQADSRVIVRIGEELYNDIVQHAVPGDWRVLKALWPNCMLVDIAMWLSYRANFLMGRPLYISWLQIEQQFGPEYSGPSRRVFRKRFLEAIKTVAPIYDPIDPECIRVDEIGERLCFRVKRPMVSNLPGDALTAASPSFSAPTPKPAPRAAADKVNTPTLF